MVKFSTIGMAVLKTDSRGGTDGKKIKETL